MRKWVVWIPMLLIASMLYWTLALSLGGLSLMNFVTPPDLDAVDANGASVNDGYQPITVNLFGLSGSQASDPNDLPEAERMPASVAVDLVSDPESGQNDERGQGDRGGGVHRDRGPGETAF